MTTKKIWVFAIVFGMFMSGLFYLWTTTNNQHNTVTAEASSEEMNKAEDVEETPINTLEIDDGKRAISIAVTEVESVSGLVKTGSYVDVVAILPAAAGEESSSQIMLTNVKVLATGTSLSNETNETGETQTTPYQMVTLEVTPSEGAKLAFAKETGTVTLMLKGSKDKETTPKIKIPLQQLQKGEISK